MGIAHAHHRLVEIDATLLQTAELEAVHDVVVGTLRIEVLHSWQRLAVVLCGERCDAVGKTFGDDVVAQVDVVVVANADSHIDRTLPVALVEHLQNHQVTLVEGALAFQRDDHLVRDGVAGNQHATLADGFLVNSHIERVRRNDVAVVVLAEEHLQDLLLVVLPLAANPVLQHVLQLVRMVAKQLLGFLRILLRHLADDVLHPWVDGDVFVRTGTVLDTLPRDGNAGRVVGRTAHLVDIPVGLQVGEVADTGIGTNTLDILIVPQGEGVVVAICEDDGVALLLQRHQIVLTEIATGIAP